MTDPATDPQNDNAELLKLIQESESMNDAERQYWMNILPIMTPEQIENLREILLNEKRQLAAIDTQYASEIEALGSEEFIQQTAEKRKERREKRSTAEMQHAEEAEEQAEDILKLIEES